MATKNYKLKKVVIKDFRGISNIEFTPGNIITVIAGKNGTGKSTVLGMIAQGFSFNPLSVLGYSEKSLNDITDIKELTQKKECITNIKTLHDGNFESTSNKHFKLTANDDKDKTHAEITVLHDKEITFEIRGTSSASHGDKPRFVTRRTTKDDSSEKDISSSNVTHPVLFIGLNRSFPIVESNIKPVIHLNEEEQKDFNNLYSNILLADYIGDVTSTSTTNKSTSAPLPKDRSLETISSGEDSVGNILSAIFSFRRLKQNFKEFKGGIILIDEIELTLYPASQLKLLEILFEEAKRLGIQIIFTTHSIFLIEHIFDKFIMTPNKIAKPTDHNDVNFIFLDKHVEKGIINREEYKLQNLYRSLLESTNKDFALIKTNIYFEDEESLYMTKQLLTPNISKYCNFISVNIACTTLLDLYRSKTPEFYEYSVIVLDGDAQEKFSDKKYRNLSEKNFVFLPSNTNPETFIYSYLSNSKSKFWVSLAEDDRYTFSQFKANNSSHIVQSIIDGTYKPENYYKLASREQWKKWFQEEKKHWSPVKYNPLKYIVKNEPELIGTFVTEFKNRLNTIRKQNGHSLID